MDIDKLQVLALESVINKNTEYFVRKVCRYYSEKFHTPLKEVHELPWTFVFTNYLEHILENNKTEEDLIELAIDICYPEKRSEEEAEIEDWIKKIEEEEENKRIEKARQQREKAKREKEEDENPQIEDSEEIHMSEDQFKHLEDDFKE